MAINVVAQMAVPVILEALKTGLQKVDHPAAAGVGVAIDALQRAVKNGHVSPEQMAAAQAHLEKMTKIEAEARLQEVSQINQSLRAEIASGDAYVRRMRPTFGYMMAVTWGAQMLALAYVIVREPGQAGVVLNAMESLGTIWAVALSVMGIYVYQRSAEKKVAYGLFNQNPSELIGSIPHSDLTEKDITSRDGINAQIPSSVMEAKEKSSPHFND